MLFGKIPIPLHLKLIIPKINCPILVVIQELINIPYQTQIQAVINLQKNVSLNRRNYFICR